jgi:hypothetical protein
MAENGTAIATVTSGRRHTSAAIVQELDTASQALTGEAAFSSVAADTLSINITDAFVAGIQLEVWAFYGDTMQCHVGELTASATINTQATETGIPFQPRALIALGAPGGFATSGTNARHAFGVCAFNDDGSVQGQCGMPLFDRATPTIATAEGGGFRTDTMLQRPTVSVLGTLTEESRFRVDNATADGFALTTLGGSTGIVLGYLAIYTGSLRAWVGNPSLDLTSTGSKSITSTGPGFRPRFLVCLGSRQTTNDAYVSDQQAIHYGIGAAVSTSQASASFHCLDSSSPNSATGCISAATLMTIVTAVGGGGLVTDWSITLTSFDSAPAGFTVNVGTASGADRQVGLLAFEDGSSPGWWDAIPQRRWRRCLGRR